MSQISIINAAVEYDGVPVLNRVDFVVRDKDRIALVGRNGCGKTTLLKLISGQIEGEKGVGEEDFKIITSGNPTVGYLKQVSNDLDGKTMREEILDAYSELLSLKEAMENTLSELEKSPSEQLSNRYSAMHEKFENMGGYVYKKEYMTAVKKFGFKDEDLDKKLKEFSGGQRTKIALLKTLLSKPDVLLLDEPTNHLDIESIEWLETYLSQYKKSFVIVSHDRMFLDKTVNAVYEIEYGEAKRYEGNYSKFIEQKKQNYEKALKDFVMRKREIERLNALVERFRYKATKAAMVQSKIKQIERIGEVNTPMHFDTATFKANFTPKMESVDKAVILEDLSFGYDRPLGHIETLIKRGEKVGVIGDNGSGKSTLIRTIMNIIKPLHGSIKFGLHTEVGYFDQTMTQSFKEDTVLDDFRDEFPMLSETELRTALGSFRFSGDDVFKRICDLSGGEKVRLALLKIFKRRPNVLILDEPTNHMDIIGKETLENMLAAFTGTVITVSHDRYFINKICDRLIVFENGGCRAFDGRYEDYERQKTAAEVQAEDRQEVKKKEKPVSKTTLENKRLHRIGVLEEKMSKLNAEIAAIKKGMNEDPEIYTDYKRLNEEEDKIKALEIQLAPLEEEWLSLSE